MCGIAGIIERERDRRVNREAVAAMTAALSHRGPDDEGTHFDGPVGLGHRRLSVIDLATGRQPMSNDDGSIWIIYNGEIYNYIELRRELGRRFNFRTQSDTEVILRLYEEHGERCLEKLNGMFAFAIWDARQQRLFAARDRFGIKPFYWTQTKERFAFASEPKALFAGGVLPAESDPEGLEEYLGFQLCLGPRTMFRGVSRLEPGHYLTYRPFRESAPTVHRWWDLDYSIDEHHTEEYFVDQLVQLLQDAVRIQLRSDVPLGAHLSGGIDSSTVVSLAASLRDQPLHTFTGGFREGQRYDETRYARTVAENVGAIHHEVWPTAEDFVEAMPRLSYMMDEPAAGPGLFPQYMVSKLAREHVTVVLGGQGGDELFGGYARYLIAYLEQVLKGAIFGTQEGGKHIVTWDSIMPNLSLLREYQPLLQSFWRDGLFEDMSSRYFRLVSRLDDADSLIAPDAWNPQSRGRMFDSFRQVFESPATKSYFNKMTNFDLKTLLPALLHVEDRTSMSVSLESRVPLLDHRIAELVSKMPPTFRFKGGDTKRVLREAVRHVLPEPVINRRDKMGFPVPLSEWMRGPIRNFVGDVLTSTNARQRGLYQMAGVERLLSHEAPFGRQVWGLLSLELWFNSFIDSPSRRPQIDAVRPPRSTQAIQS